MINEMASALRKSRLILGIGNLLMGDEGIGVHAIQHLQHGSFASDVHLLDGGTGGFHLLSLFDEHDPIILIDATMDGKEAGTVTLTEPRFASDFPKTLTAHDIGLRDLVESAALVSGLPKLYLVAVSISEVRSMDTSLSPKVAESLPKIVEIVNTLLKSGN
jgi:hydrogenase maturation protease